MSKISSKIEGDYELVTEKVTLKPFLKAKTMMGRCLHKVEIWNLIGKYFPVPSASEVDSGKIASRVVACRNDSKRQHGHLLPQVSLAIFTQSVDEQAYLVSTVVCCWAIVLS